MKKYDVEISEILSRIITVKAENEDEAIDEVRKIYEGGEYVLDYNDFQEVEFNLL